MFQEELGRGPIRVAVMADTHGMLRPEVERILETCDVIIHAGDFDNQMLYHKLNVNQPLYAVRGNNDRGWSGGLPLLKRFEIGGIKFIMAHERVDIPSALGDIQVAVFGHSHMYYQQMIGGRLWLNPGSCGYKRFTLPLSMAVMTIERASYEVETIWLEKGYGTPGAAKEQVKTPKAGKYEKQQRKYQQKTGKAGKDLWAAAGAGKGSGEVACAGKGSGEAACAGKGSGEAACAGKDLGNPASAGKDSGNPVLAHKEKNQEDPQKERDGLFLAAKIIRLKQAGESRSWVVKNLGPESRFSGALYDLCEKHPGFNARQIWELLKSG